MRRTIVIVTLCFGLGMGSLGLGLLWAQSEEKAAKAAAVPANVPASAKKLANPEKATPESVAAGKNIYSSQCAMCHATNGDGQGDLAKRFKYTMPDFTDAAYQDKRVDGEIYYVLTHGHGKMSGEGDRLSEKVRWDLVNYIRTLTVG